MNRPDLIPPPLDFTPLTQCEWAEYSEQAPAFIRPTRKRGRRLQGIKYENKARAAFADRFGSAFMPSQWIRYRGEDGRIRWCQPDAVLHDKPSHSLTIIEFKYNHTDVAWWQLFRLYRPVLECLFNGYGYEFRCVEVCRWFDPSTRCSVRPQLREDVLDLKPDVFNVHIWNP